MKTQDAATAGTVCVFPCINLGGVGRTLEAVLLEAVEKATSAYPQLGQVCERLSNYKPLLLDYIKGRELVAWLDFELAELDDADEPLLNTSFPICSGDRYLFGEDLMFVEAEELAKAAESAGASGFRDAQVGPGQFEVVRHVGVGDNTRIELHCKRQVLESFTVPRRAYVEAIRKALERVWATRLALLKAIADLPAKYYALVDGVERAFDRVA